jgi:hypothetical protein
MSGEIAAVQDGRIISLSVGTDGITHNDGFGF